MCLTRPISHTCNIQMRQVVDVGLVIPPELPFERKNTANRGARPSARFVHNVYKRTHQAKELELECQRSPASHDLLLRMHQSKPSLYALAVRRQVLPVVPASNECRERQEMDVT